jgi:diguanylate cyclase (GGDEF)-like protein
VIKTLAAFAAGAMAVVAATWWRARWRRMHPMPLPPGVAFERVGNRTSPYREVRASMLKSIRDPENPGDRAEMRERELADDLRGYLGDVAAQHGADDAMLWMRGEESAPLLAVAWNHSGAPPSTAWGTAQQRELVAWAAQEGVVTFDGSGDEHVLAASRVSLDHVAARGAPGQVVGALVLHAAAGIRSSRGDMKLWLPRHAERMAQLVELQVTRNEVARANRRMRVLVRSVQELDSSGEHQALEKRIVESILEASGAIFAVLVEWQAESQRGTVHYASTMYPEPQPHAGDPVEASSLVGAVCIDGTPRFWDYAEAVAASDELFAPGALVPHAGALAILPMRRNKRIIGAIVIGTTEAGALRQADLKTAGFFAQLAGSALEAAWEIEEVKTEARIDQLTGLSNRRHFDDELKRALDQTDRFGGSCALVLADVDHFKSVNDTFGHEAGDKVLKTLAAIMLEIVRNTDTCARIGGEEFCVILPQTGLVGAVEMAERLRSSIEKMPIRWRDKDIHVTSSFGVATYEAGGGAVKRGQLFDATDRALYRAKGDGRNCVRTA